MFARSNDGRGFNLIFRTCPTFWLVFKNKRIAIFMLRHLLSPASAGFSVKNCLSRPWDWSLDSPHYSRTLHSSHRSLLLLLQVLLLYNSV
jgi:hypothetical protein